MSLVAKFKDISSKVEKKEMTVEDALIAIKDIDFNLFSIEEIEAVQNATWLPDQEAVDIMKGWMRLQDQVLLELRAFLVVTPEITKDMLLSFVKAVKVPSQVPSLTVENVINKLATAGGARKFRNPIEFGLIQADNSQKDGKVSDLYKIFDPDPYQYYSSAPTSQSAVIFTLPPFLKIQIEKYQIGTPKTKMAKKGGIQSWVLEVTDDPTLLNWKKQIAQVQNDTKLMTENTTVTFDVDDPKAGFYRHIRLMSTGQSHLGNLSMVLKNFDITGKLIIAKD